jgi:alkanesulfonate monooxygenase SsuD/methylene tetrahydromethanopterin reductase-like flavin-dependent oxidoreductase (luciferase family)
VLPNLQIYRDAWKAAGHAGKGEVYLRAPVYVGDTVEQALSDPEESLMQFYRYLGARLEESANRAGIFDTARRIEGAQRLQTMTYDEARSGRAILGTPEMVADRLAELREQLGLSGILAELNCGGLVPHERVMRSLQLLCEKVQPRLH